MLIGGEWVGQVIDGRYAVEEVLGAGGMGVVLRCLHTFTGGRVAVKILRPDFTMDPKIQARFLGEARAPNAIGHPNIVVVHDAGKMPDGALYLAMELIAGDSLRKVLQTGGVTAAEARRIALELLDALAAAHARGFVHRDLKPENLMLAGPGRVVKLLDFGIAKVLTSGLPTMGTAAGVTMGTPGYMAPEQLRDASTVDERADLWAVGIIVYELLSGRLPYPARTLETVLHALQTEEPAPISRWMPAVAPEISAFFARALSRDVAGRFASAREMAAALAALPLGQAAPVASAAATMPSTQPTQVSVMEPVPSAPRKRWVGTAVGIAAGLVMVGVVTFAVATRHHGSTPTPVDAAARIDAAMPVDAAVVVDAAPPDARDVVADCKAACPRFIACGFQYTERCAKDCEAKDPRGAAFLICAGKLDEGCDAFARCVFETNCGTRNVARGAKSCQTVALCQGACQKQLGDGSAGIACGCQCVVDLRADMLKPLLHLDVTGTLYGGMSTKTQTVFANECP